jgi:general secretion pathway protein A
MYLEFYGLREMPFNITPDPKFLYLSRFHHEALQHLKYGIEEKKGFIVLTGEVGCGKTTLCRRLLAELSPDRYDTALILNPRVTETQLLRAILTELGVARMPRGRNELIDTIYQETLNRIQEGREVVVIIDESQNLSYELLEQLRLLSNLETDTRKLLQIILIGQPELHEILMEKRLRQLRQRILVSYDLSRLTKEDTSCYIQHRLTLAGASGRPRFTPWATRKVFGVSKGTPRMINNLCDNALLSAYARSSDTVDYWDVCRARKQLNY